MRIHRILSTFVFVLLCLTRHAGVAENSAAKPADHGVQVRITVIDTDGKLPIELAHVVLRRNGKFVAQDATNPAGLIRFRDLEPGRYNVSAWFVGFKNYVDSIMIDETHSTFIFALRSEGTEEKEIIVTADRELAVSHIDPRTGNQVFESETYHVPPTARRTDLLQENIMGAARAPT